MGLQLQFAPNGATIEWETQVHAEGLRPDMVGKVGERAFVFEHKAWSPLRPNQLQNYRDLAVLKYGKQNYHLILITAASYLIDQNPDLALCPNCHREAHASPDRDKIKVSLLKVASRFAENVGQTVR